MMARDWIFWRHLSSVAFPATLLATVLGFLVVRTIRNSLVNQFEQRHRRTIEKKRVEKTQESERYRAIAYYPSWAIYARGYLPENVPADKLTHLLYAFADNKPDGTVFLGDGTIGEEEVDWKPDWYTTIENLNLLKRRNKNMKLLLSIGGWQNAYQERHFDAPASTEAGRQRFADSCIDLIKHFGFDGIDIDAAYPQNCEDGNNLQHLLRSIRSAMDAYAIELGQGSCEQPHFVLSLAGPADQDFYRRLPLGNLAQIVDFINLKAYDFSGSWSPNVAHQANLHPSKSMPACTPLNADSIINFYTSNGVPHQKIVLGMPLFGRAFENTSGLGEAFEGIGQSGSWENGVWDYRDLPRPDARDVSDEDVGANYSYDSLNKTLISYDNLPISSCKAQYIKDKKLGGAMWWELSADKRGEEEKESIIANVVRILGGDNTEMLENSPNWQTYPDLRFKNLREDFLNI
ncbi:hypothetical protein E8E13_002284 [Curvularia kusanoi]|uniref:chitinase n=1 Tax=Curvularia kusanoi TaxID=90978 RepID=A0A9P4T4G0_CURKU|nr:hypothetical protein E8E13_002284 [Curvularia kusanoi]